VSESDPVRCLIVGMGGISRYMLRTLKSKPWLECAGVADVKAAAPLCHLRLPEPEHCRET